MIRRFPRRHGAALIITLAMIAMMTFLVVAFFSRAVSNLQVETASTGTVRADLLARSACGIVISDFRTEIIAGSTVLGSGAQQPIYVPKTAATSIPSLARLQTAGGIDYTPFVNLVKQSGGAFFASGGDYGSTLKPIIQTVTTVPTDLVSANGRTVVNYRWDSPTSVTPLGPMLCVGDLGYSHYYASRLLPHWIMMTRDGVPAAQSAAAIPSGWKNYTADNKDAAIGRFAYNIYNVGGLMDVNTAGYDESPGTVVPLTAVGQKGTLALAKLSLIPGITSDTNAALFAKTWRNAASGSSADNYLAFLGFSKNGSNSLVGNPFFLAGPKTGFLQAAASTTASDNRVLGRQDLIRLAVKTGTPYGLNLTSLPYLTHFSREVNAPSWSPTQDASTMGGNNGTGTPVPYAYLTNKDSAAVPNRFIPNVRVGPNPSGWRRLTGELAVEGEPLVKYRFPLSWLAILQNKTPTSSTWVLTDEAIAIVNALHARNLANGGPGFGTTDQARAAYMALRAFGLVWDPTDTTPHTPTYPLNLGSHWNYNGNATSTNPGLPVATRIALLGESATPPAGTIPAAAVPVTRDKREANFFELLKAGILSGSLGNASDYESMCVTVGEDSYSDYQVMQIGANMIDQVDSDSYPTKIIFGYRFDNPAAIKSVRAPDYGSGNVPAQTSEAKLISGVEDLPYIYTALSTPYRLPAGQKNLNTGLAVPAGDFKQTTQRDTLDAWLQFVLWKPQQKAVSSAAPSKFRILYTGTDTHLTYFGKTTMPYDNFGGVDFKYQDSTPVLVSSGSPTGHDQQPYLSFTDAADDFRAPTLLGGMSAEPAPYPQVAPPNDFDCSQPQGKGFHPDPSNPSVPIPLPRGLWIGEMYRPEFSTTTNPAPTGNTSYAQAPPTQHTEFRTSANAKIELQYDQDGSGNWRTYQRYDRFAVGTGASNYAGRSLYGYADSPTGQTLSGSPVYSPSNPPAFTALDISTLAISAIDPRTHRFGLLAQSAPDQGNPGFIPPSSSLAFWKTYLKQGWSPQTATPYWMTFAPSSTDGRFLPNWNGGISDNPWQSRSTDNPVKDPTPYWADDSLSSTYYKDVDLVQRRSDGDMANGVFPMQINQTTPITARTQDLGRVLNRPFRSVGELGYVFRDEPYKSLNMFTDKSADSALMDIFSVNEQPAFVAGKVNLNAKNAEILQAMIVAASREELSTTNVINTADALTIAQKLVANTSAAPGTNTGPLINPAEIANRMATILPISGGDANTAIKARREVVGRALAGSGQTRTWNFLVDIIAQSGRFGPAATLPSQFVVEGEKRYWLHVAIDRYTGQVVDQQLEPVME